MWCLKSQGEEVESRNFDGLSSHKSFPKQTLQIAAVLFSQNYKNKELPLLIAYLVWFLSLVSACFLYIDNE